LWISGSPPAITTIGAPHSSTDSSASSTGNAFVQDLVRIVDLAATGAGEIAAEQRLQHQHERIALAALDMLLDDVAADPGDLKKRDAQNSTLRWRRQTAA
jgi:hypothetical protein